MIKEILPLTNRKLKILLAFYTHTVLHASKIVSITGIDKQNVSLHLQRFRKQNIILFHKKIGRVCQYTLHEKLTSLFPLIEEYRKELLFQKYPIVQKIYRSLSQQEVFERIEKIYLIGSYAQMAATKESDIDFIVISNTDINSQLYQSKRKIEKRYDKKIQTHLFTKASMKKEQKANSLFFETTMKHKKDHICL